MGTSNKENDRIKEWKKFISKFEKALDVTVTGFDPTISFYDNRNDPYSLHHQIPMWLAKRILEKIEEGRPLPTKKSKNGEYIKGKEG